MAALGVLEECFGLSSTSFRGVETDESVFFLTDVRKTTFFLGHKSKFYVHRSLNLFKIKTPAKNNREWCLLEFTGKKPQVFKVTIVF